MDRPRTKASLSQPRRTLIELMQRLNYGHIADLGIERGEPIFDAGLRIVKEIKLGSSNGPRPELDKADFVLKDQVIELFEHLDTVGNGRIALIEIRYGLPVRMAVEQPIVDANLLPLADSRADVGGVCQ